MPLWFIADWGVCARSIRRVGGYDEIINSRSVFGQSFRYTSASDTFIILSFTCCYYYYFFISNDFIFIICGTKNLTRKIENV